MIFNNLCFVFINFFFLQSRPTSVNYVLYRCVLEIFQIELPFITTPQPMRGILHTICAINSTVHRNNHMILVFRLHYITKMFIYVKKMTKTHLFLYLLLNMSKMHISMPYKLVTISKDLMYTMSIRRK